MWRARLVAVLVPFVVLGSTRSRTARPEKRPCVEIVLRARRQWGEERLRVPSATAEESTPMLTGPASARRHRLGRSQMKRGMVWRVALRERSQWGVLMNVVYVTLARRAGREPLAAGRARRAALGRIRSRSVRPKSRRNAEFALRGKRVWGEPLKRARNVTALESTRRGELASVMLLERDTSQRVVVG